MAKAKRTLDELLGQMCDTCDKWFETMQVLMSNQSTSTKCAWYKKGKLMAVFEPTPTQRASSLSEFNCAQWAQQSSRSINIERK